MTETVLSRIIDLLEGAGRQTSDGAPPIALLWPDPEREFTGVSARIGASLPLVTLGAYAADSRTGPAIWIRCLLAGTIDGADVPTDRPMIVYLPGYGKDQIRDIECGPSELAPLSDLQFRGTLWLQKGGREWTARTLLGATGIGLDLAQDGATKDALGRAFPRLLNEPISELRRGQLDAAYLNELLAPDPERLLLRWLNEPTTTEADMDPDTWSAFLDTCRDVFGFDPESDGPITGARLLGERKGPWAKVWAAFSDVPERYAQIPERLRAAEPDVLVPEPRDSWPGANERAEENLRESLVGFDRLTFPEASAKVRELEAAHGERRGWVWARVGFSPLAQGLEHLAVLAERCAAPLAGGSASQIAVAYVTDGWKVDRAVIEALTVVCPGPAAEAMNVAVRALYEGWLDQGARALQEAFRLEALAPASAEDEYTEGTCLYFVDGLRFDVAAMVVEHLGAAAQADLGWRFSAVPSVTPTAKPAVSPVARLLHPGPDFSPSASSGGAPLDAAGGLRGLMKKEGWQILGEGGWGDPRGRGWFEGGNIDRQGHNLPAKLPARLRAEAREIADQVLTLLAWGWKRVVVVTDHGWLLLPGGLPKVDLPINTADVRKGRCARLPENAKVQHQTLPWRWDPSVRIAVAPGIACFEAGTVYEHGGVSPQESVTPYLVVEAGAQVASAPSASITVIAWTGFRCRVEGEAPEGTRVDIRMRPPDPTSSAVSEPRPLEKGRCALVVADDQLEGQAAAVVLLAPDGTLLGQRFTAIAGEGER